MATQARTIAAAGSNFTVSFSTPLNGTMRPYGKFYIPLSRIRLLTRMALMIRSSAIHAAGCYTTTQVRKGSRVAEYTGHLMTKEEADKRYENSPVTYLFGLGDGSMVIDGHSMTMFINHSCDANCETEEIDGHVYVVATRDIKAGEEITYDYCLYDGGEDEANCNCGSKDCRQTMYSPEEVKSRRKKARQNGKKPAERPRTASGRKS